ncbi:hypothetical protein PILCRDRAFT_810908 [Piloderma croceum F 1598]|uniref:DNA mismatch repair protein n=1 Tax=Piloderma croceum (strain F 1598) TaxID=765440 RepID=A0A0C3GJ15_PILCF|nr:hypothetical protein PILCRDRAFT_810908 [Piloderma croceum F 1598]
MAPAKAKTNDNSMKQKSLMSFFGKPAADKSSQKPVPERSEKPLTASNASKSRKPSTPESKGSDMPAPTSSAEASSRSSGGECSVMQTPPTSSDPIDVDMLSEEESVKERVQAKSTRVKRKIVIDDSDEEDVSLVKKQSSYTASSPKSSATKSRAKKPRVSAVLLDDDDEEDGEAATSLSLKLTKFKRAPSQSSRKSQASDDDDFLIPSDSSMPTSSHRRFSSGSSASSRRSSAVDDSDEDSFIVPDSGSDIEAAQPKKSKGKSSSKSTRPSLKKGDTGASSGGGNSFAFLTAAEQREQGKKNEKKSTEDPYSFLQDVRDKDGVRPGEPDYDPRTLTIPASAWKEFTPFEKQFWEIKQNHYDTILFFQKGKFLELYEDDARVGHTEFDLKLTQRVKMSMVGVPEMSFNFWAAKFLGKGYKVGRVDQAETALGAEMRVAADKSKGKASTDRSKDKIVRRELNKVYTNGTLVDQELLTDEQAGHCISVRESAAEEANAKTNNSFGICVLDSSTSEFSLSAFEDDVCRTKLETMMRQLRPKEVIFKKGNLSVATTRLLKSILPASCLWTSLRDSEGFSYDQTLTELKTMYPADEDDSMGDDDELLSEAVPQSIRDMVRCNGAMEALGAMIWYLRQLNIDKDIMSMKNFNVYDPMKRGQGLVLDGQSLAHVEVLLNSEGTEEGSLLKLLSRCITPFGKRLFRIWLCMPLRDVSEINARLDAVQDLLNHPTFEQEFTEVAKGLPDLERIVSRIHAKNCKVKDFLKVLTAFKKLSKGLDSLADTSESFESKTVLGLLRSAPDLLPGLKNVKAMYQNPEEGADELVPVDGKDDVYDSIMTKIKELEQELNQQLKMFEKSLGCSLSYWHSAIGNKEIYLVQTKPGQKNIPSQWTKSGGTKSATRWVVPSLQGTIRSLKEARENRTTAVKNFKYRLFDEFDTDRGVWLRATRVFAELDCLLSLAKSSSAMGEPVCRPQLVEGDAAWVEFEELRHPALCVRPGMKDFIPNNVKLGGDVGRIALLTGPNMGGKSTVMRMTAAGVIMAQLGMLVPAKSARLCPVDSILTRMGAYDAIGASTFKVELDECCKILRDATPKSFVILDELGRGTSTYDGMAIAGAVLHQLATHTLPLSFFATHYGSLTDDFAYHPNIRNMHMATLVDDEKRELVFLYKLVEGVASSSFGTHVANLAGVPVDVVKRAEVVSADFARQFKEKLEGKQKKSATARLPLVAQADFAYLYGLATGNYMIPADPYKQRELLKRLKETVRKYIKT